MNYSNANSVAEIFTSGANTMGVYMLNKYKQICDLNCGWANSMIPSCEWEQFRKINGRNSTKTKLPMSEILLWQIFPHRLQCFVNMACWALPMIFMRVPCILCFQILTHHFSLKRFYNFFHFVITFSSRRPEVMVSSSSFTLLSRHKCYGFQFFNIMPLFLLFTALCATSLSFALCSQLPGLHISIYFNL